MITVYLQTVCIDNTGNRDNPGKMLEEYPCNRNGKTVRKGTTAGNKRGTEHTSRLCWMGRDRRCF